MDEIRLNSLMVAAQNGDPDAFGTLYIELRPWLFNLCCNWTKRANDADDLMHDVFLMAFRKRDRYIDRGQFLSWLYKVARRVWLDRVKRNRLKMTEIRDIAASKAASAECAAEITELAGLCQSIVSKMSSDRRETITRFVAGETLPSIAKSHNCPTPTAKSRLRLAREEVRRQLETIQ